MARPSAVWQKCLFFYAFFCTTSELRDPGSFGRARPRSPHFYIGSDKIKRVAGARSLATPADVGIGALGKGF